MKAGTKRKNYIENTTFFDNVDAFLSISEKGETWSVSS
jgi:hypothetical protein